MKRAYVFLMLALGSSGAGCGRQDLDLLVQVQKDDPCLDFTTEGDCRKNTALGCSYQPNAEGCRTSDPSCQPGMCRSGDPFVRRAARSFLLNGQHFRFAGVSSWALLQPGSCGSVKANERVAWIERAYDELVPARAKVARTFAFQSSAGPSGDDFTLFDASVRAARRAGIRLQLVLENVEGGCSQGMRRDDAWYTSGYQTPDGSYALSYRAFAEAVATRYRDEPTVLGYVLMQSFGGASPSALASFATEMGQRLHGIAPSQLLSLDLEWGSLPDDGGATYLQLQDLPEVDFVDVDDYTLMYPPKPQDPTLLQTLAKIDKPAIIGEGAFGLLAADDAALAMRADEAKQRVAQWYEEGFSGALLWAYQPGWGPVSEEFDARPADPMLQPGGVLASAPW